MQKGIPVSYTHLDVYKRQVLNYGLSLRSILLPGSQTDVALGQDGIYCIEDVYKRQH